LRAEGHDRINVQNNPVNWIDPLGLEYSKWNTTPYDIDYGGPGGFAPLPSKGGPLTPGQEIIAAKIAGGAVAIGGGILTENPL
jgi:hypothetical protein